MAQETLLKLLARVTDFILGTARAVYYTLRPQVILMRGRDKNYNEILNICHVGNRPRGYRLGFPSQVLRELESESDLGPYWLWQLPALLKDIESDFLLIETPRYLKWLAHWLVAGSKETFYIPFFVHSIIDASDFPALLRNNHNLKNDIRKTKKAGYSLELSSDPAQYRTFLDFYYRPYMKASHGLLASSFDYDFLCHEDFLDRDRWLLLKLMQGGEWVAGMIVKTDKHTAYGYEVGIKCANSRHVKGGALMSLRWLYSQQMLSLGFREISFMWSPPFLENGVLSSKRKYHPKLEAAPSSGVGLLLVHRGVNSLSTKILLELSIIQQRGPHLKATRCVARPEDFDKARDNLVKACHHYRGISGFEVNLIHNKILMSRT
jgi:Acetyltransferase (GNAT) domain